MVPFPELGDRRPRSCWLEIDLDALVSNLSVVRKALSDETTLMAVVKAEAYGHGAEMVAHTLSGAGVSYFGVATLEEALKLREFGIEDRILIMGHLATFSMDRLLEHDLTPFVYSFRVLNALEREAKRRQTTAPFHLKVDTGMGRLGLKPEDVSSFLEEVRGCDHLELQGVASHLAVAGEDTEYTRSQEQVFKRIREMVEDMGFRPRFWHLQNTASIFSRDRSIGTMARPGIALYGYSPSEEIAIPELDPVMQVKCKMADYKQLDPGRGVSYGRIFVPEEPTWIGVLPMGYADGYPRSLSNQAYVLKDGRRCPVLGHVCMDMTMIKLSARDDPEQTVTLMGSDGSEELWADRLAEWHGTIPYEILSSFSQRLPRIYLKKGRVVGMKTERSIEVL